MRHAVAALTMPSAVLAFSVGRDAIRLTTLHPALVHFVIGPLPVIVVAYAVAAAKRSERWTLVGDFALIATAGLSLAALAFGVVSNAVLEWPGGFQTWRSWHVALGISSVGALVGIAGVRIVVRRSRPSSSWRTVVACSIASGLVLFTGWIGGEVLVFHAGMAVRAAAEGALAPSYGSRSTPSDLRDAMGKLRGQWADAHVRAAGAIVWGAKPEDFSAIVADAKAMREIAQWIDGQGGLGMRDPSAPTHDEHRAAEHHEPPMTRARHLSEMARMLDARARQLEQAAGRQQLDDVLRADGELQVLCVDCHDELRWTGSHAPEVSSVGTGTSLER
jgi:uncharacterized membrane protein